MKKLSLLLLLILLISGCSESDSTTAPDITLSPTPGMVLIQTGISTPTLTPVPPTRTPIPSYTPRPTNTLPTPTQTLTITPTFNPRFVVTATRAPAAECPQPADNPPTPENFYFVPFDETIEREIDYLTKYGPSMMIAEFDYYDMEEGYDYLYRDLTNDGVPEFGFGERGFRLYGCSDSKYLMLQQITNGDLSRSKIEAITDLNKNGVPEILILVGFYSQGGSGYELLEWNGNQFTSILYVNIPPYSVIFHEDLDNDSFDEWVFYHGIPVWSIYKYGLPWRRVKDYYRWNGDFYSQYKQIYDPPIYRFQAAQDADYLTSFQEYDAALTLYQDAIFSDLLKPWSPDWLQYEQALWDLSYGSSGPTPTLPSVDPDEYPNLAAYSRYRIMLLHVARGYLPEAEIVYNTLQEKFSEGQQGYMFAELAREFWEEYLVSQNIEQSCSAAIQYAEDHVDTIFYYISSNYHGDQSRRYEPEDICPFK